MQKNQINSIGPGLLGNMGWLGAGNLIVKPIWFIFITYICITQMGFYEYGVMNAAIALAAILSGLANMGTSAYTIREVARDLEKARNFYRAFFPFRVVTLFLAFLLAVGFGFLLGHESKALLAVASASIYMSLQSLTQFTRSIYRAAENLKWESVSTVGEKMLVVLLGSLFVFLKPEAWFVLLGMSLGMFLTLLSSYWWASKMVLKKQPHTTESRLNFIKEHLPQAFPLGLAALFILIYFRTDSVMLEAMLGEIESGEYGLAFRFLEAFTMLPAVMVAALLPKFSKQFGSGQFQAMSKLFTRSSAFLLLASVSLAAITSYFAPYVMSFLGEGDSGHASASALRILIWAFPFTSLAYLLSTSLTALNQQKFLALALGITALLNLILNYFLISEYQIWGACLATIVTQSILSVILFWKYLSKRKKLLAS